MSSDKSSVPANPYKVRSGLSRIWHATLYSYQGFFSAVKHESAFRQELLLAICMLPFAFMLGKTATEIALLILSVVLVLVVELLNSAIEAVVDRISYDWHELAKRAKDYGSASVHLTLLFCGGLWGCFVVRAWV